MATNKTFNFNGLSHGKSPVLAATNTLGNGLGTPFGQIMNEIVRRPGIVRQTDQMLAMSNNKELQSFYAGSEYGHSRGFSEGFSKGLSLAMLGLLFIALNNK